MGVLYIQCRIEKEISSGKLVTMRWIPENLAVLGEYIKRRVNGVMEDGWKITAASGPAYPESYIRRVQRTFMTSIDDQSCF